MGTGWAEAGRSKGLGHTEEQHQLRLAGGSQGPAGAVLHRLWLSGEVSGAWRGFGRLLWLEVTVVSQECSHTGLS